MSINLEQLRNRFAQSGYADVAQDLDDVLRRYTGKLPPHLPDEGLSQDRQIDGFTFEYEEAILPITIRALRDRRYTLEIIDSLFSNSSLGERFNEAQIHRTQNIVRRQCWQPVWDEESKRLHSENAFSVDDLLRLSDDDLLDFRNMGPKFLQIFHAAFHPLRDALRRV